MAIHESKKQSDLEKRLKLLRQQVYGKGEFKVKEKISTNYQLPTTQLSTDITFLHQDLLKILTLSSIAIGFQFILFMLLKNHILNLHLF